MAEKLGRTRACDGCGKVGRERTVGLDPKKWCCSAACAVKVMTAGEWGSLGWLKAG